MGHPYIRRFYGCGLKFLSGSDYATPANRKNLPRCPYRRAAVYCVARSSAAAPISAQMRARSSSSIQ